MPYRILGVEFAPWNIPLERRLQTLAIIIYLTLQVVVPFLSWIIFLLILFSRYYWLSLGYASWMYYDNYILKTPSKGGRRSQRVRKWKLWKLAANFFPISLVKTTDLDRNKNYIFGYHPHGIVSFGAATNFGTEATGFSDIFKGITPYPLTLKLLFNLPLVRNIPLWLGFCDVSKESMYHILTEHGKGNAIVVVIGGAAEALDAKPGSPAVVLQNRKGFIKIALKTGTSLVPVFSFGENDIFYQADNPVGSRLRKFQDTFKKLIGISPPLFYGRGVFNYTFGLIPFRKPIHTVVGAPIDLPKLEDPSPEEVDKFHQKYIDSLCQLFDQHKTKYGMEENTNLLIL